MKIFTNLAEDPSWCCWSVGRRGRRCSDSPALSTDLHPAWNSDSPILCKDSLICCMGSPVCRMCSPAYYNCSQACCTDSLACCSPNNSWLRYLTCLEREASLDKYVQQILKKYNNILILVTCLTIVQHLVHFDFFLNFYFNWKYFTFKLKLYSLWFCIVLVFGNVFGEASPSQIFDFVIVLARKVLM